MSLVGNLQDLGLGEILQIVSLSRKTGVLTLHGDGQEGMIVFRQGQVVRASSSMHQQSLGRILLQDGLIDLSVLRKALAIQQEEGFRERLGVILIKRFGIARNVIEKVVCRQIENAVFSLFEWQQGDFEFAMHDEMETVDGIRMDPLQFMLDQGLSPQFLALEGTRLIDERLHGAAGEPAGEEAVDLAFDLVGNEQEHHPASREPLVIVDDDGPTLQTLAVAMRENGFEVHALSRSEDALITVDALFRSGARPTVLIDLIMPRMDGSGVHGGMELLDLLRLNFRELPIVVMADHRNGMGTAASDQAYPFILKPSGMEIGIPEKLRAFLAALLPEIRRVSTGDSEKTS